MCASLKDDVRYDVYPCVCSPRYQHCYSFEDFQHKHEDLFEEVKTNRDVFTIVISDVKSYLCYTYDNERLLISLDSDLTFNEEIPMIDVTNNVERSVEFFI